MPSDKVAMIVDEILAQALAKAEQAAVAQSESHGWRHRSWDGFALAMKGVELAEYMLQAMTGPDVNTSAIVAALKVRIRGSEDA